MNILLAVSVLATNGRRNIWARSGIVHNMYAVIVFSSDIVWKASVLIVMSVCENSRVGRSQATCEWRPSRASSVDMDPGLIDVRPTTSHL